MKSLSILFLSLLISLNLLAQIDTNDFVTTWKTDNLGFSNNSSITIFTDAFYIYNYDVDWNNDGVFDTLGVNSNITHTYSVPGIYTIRIRGLFPSIKFGGVNKDQEKIVLINQWGGILFSNMFQAFLNCANLGYAASDKPIFDLNCNANQMFMNAIAFNGNVSSWNVANISTMRRMFSGAISFNQNLNLWDVSLVTSMSAMFSDASSFNGALSSWDVSSVFDMSYMFEGANNFNRDIGNWNVANVVNMISMFNEATIFNQNIGNWDVGSVIFMDRLFREARAFNQNLGLWDISSVTRMNEIFNNNSIGPVSLSISNYDSTLIGWQANPHQMNVNLSAWGVKYCLADSARTLLIADGWNFSGDRRNCRTTSLEGQKIEAQLSIFPNPTNGIVNFEVEGTFQNQEIQILNSLGQIVKAAKVLGTKSIQFDLSEFPEGMYYVKQNNSVSKVVVVK